MNKVPEPAGIDDPENEKDKHVEPKEFWLQLIKSPAFCVAPPLISLDWSSQSISELNCQPPIFDVEV